MAKEDKVLFISDYMNEKKLNNLSDRNKLSNITYEEILRIANFAEHQRTLSKNINDNDIEEKIAEIIEYKTGLIEKLRELKKIIDYQVD